jgi:hypothetical protein
MFDTRSTTATLYPSWLRGMARIASWWICATLLSCLRPTASPDSIALAVYFLLETPLAVVALSNLCRQVQMRWGVAVAGLPGPGARLMAVFEGVVTFSVALLLSPW